MSENPNSRAKSETGELKIRIKGIHKDIWIDCPQSRKALRSIVAVIEVPERTTAPCILISGPGGMGKTTIVNQLRKKNRSLGSPFVFLSLAENPSNLKFKQLILEALGLSIRLELGKSILNKDVAAFIQAQGIVAIVIDEFHELLLVPKNEQLKNLSLLKALTGAPFYLSIIGLGTKSARNALTYDEQLARRFHIQELLPWSMDDDFRSFLATLEKHVALKHESHLHQEDFVRLIHYHSDGTMDNVVKIVKAAAIYAITTGQERITKDLIEKAVVDPWGY